MRPLFDTASQITIVVPEGEDRQDVVALIEHEIAEFEVELGGEVSIASTPPGSGPVLELRPDETIDTTTLHRPEADRVVASGPDLATSLSAVNLLRTMRRTGLDSLSAEPTTGTLDAIDRVEQEVMTTWPSLARLDVDWGAAKPQFDPAGSHDDTIDRLRRWVALLGDGHTGVHPRSDLAALPYAARLHQGALEFVDVPPGTPLAEAGVTAGAQLLDIDVERIIAMSGAPPHPEPWLVGRRALSGAVGQPLPLIVRRTDGSIVEVDEHPGRSTWPQPIEWTVRPSGSGYLRIRQWTTADGPLIDQALSDLGRCPRLIVDLRGNAGGQLVAAVAFRRRFVLEPSTIGSIRFSVGDGTVAPPAPFVDSPSSDRRWLEPVRFLTDGLTYSASEDAILGLGQFDHVEVVGEPSGGGSGRPRTVPVLGSAVLTVSTALTFDHAGRLVEGNGIHLDRPLPAGPDAVESADSNW